MSIRMRWPVNRTRAMRLQQLGVPHARAGGGCLALRGRHRRSLRGQPLPGGRRLWHSEPLPSVAHAAPDVGRHAAGDVPLVRVDPQRAVACRGVGWRRGGWACAWVSAAGGHAGERSRPAARYNPAPAMPNQPRAKLPAPSTHHPTHTHPPNPPYSSSSVGTGAPAASARLRYSPAPAAPAGAAPSTQAARQSGQVGCAPCRRQFFTHSPMHEAWQLLPQAAGGAGGCGRRVAAQGQREQLRLCANPCPSHQVSTKRPSCHTAGLSNLPAQKLTFSLAPSSPCKQKQASEGCLWNSAKRHNHSQQQWQVRHRPTGLQPALKGGCTALPPARHASPPCFGPSSAPNSPHLVANGAVCPLCRAAQQAALLPLPLPLAAAPQ